MAQFNKKTGTLLSNNDTLYEITLHGDIYGRVSYPPMTTAFGETTIAELSPSFQMDGLYGLPSTEFTTNSRSGGTQYVSASGLMTVSSSTTPGGFSALRSNRSVRYRPGQGSVARFTAMFPNGPVTGYQQVAGFINQSDGLAVGYNVNNTEFGIIRRQDSEAEVAKFVITNPASGAETVTITLDDVAFNIPVTAGTIQKNTAELGNFAYAGWIVDYSNNAIRLLYDGPPGPLAGAFSISSTGALTGTYTKLQTGNTPNDTWVYQSQFNIDKLDGFGPSKMRIDPTKLNVFQIDFRWLGAGRIRYLVEDENTGNLVPFHIEKYTNNNIKPHISNPSMRVGYAVVNAAPQLGTGVDVLVQGASIMGAVEGKIVRNQVSKAVRMQSSTNLTANVIHHLLTLKNDRFNEQGKPNVINQREIILTSLSASATENGSSGAAISFILYKNISPVANLEYSIFDDSTDYSTTVTTISTALDTEIIGVYTIAPGGQLNEDLAPLRIVLSPLETLHVGLLSTAQTSSQACALNFEVE